MFSVVRCWFSCFVMVLCGSVLVFGDSIVRFSGWLRLVLVMM